MMGRKWEWRFSLILFSEFCASLYQFKGPRIKSQSAFVVRLFNAVSSSWSQGKSEDYNYAKKIFEGGTKANPVPFPPTVRNSVPQPFQFEDAYNFFKAHLSEGRLKAYFPDLVNDPAAEFDFDSVCHMCAAAFGDFIANGEPIPKTFEQYYDEAFAFSPGVGTASIQVSENEFILEARNHCPLCSKREGLLTYTYKGSIVRNFRIAKIYPDVLPAGQESQFRLHTPYRPEPNSPNNLIALCRTHFAEYTASPDFETYKTLLAAKHEMIRSKEFIEEVEKADLSQIEDIIVYLNEHTPDLEGEDLTLALKNVEEKIDYKNTPAKYYFYYDVMHFVRTSYKQINSYLADYEFKSDGSTELGRKIKKMSAELMSRGRGEKYVFDTLVEALVGILPPDEKNKSYCAYIVAYFIAHCEVLTKNETA